MVMECESLNGPDSVVPDWPVSTDPLFCKDVPQRLQDTRAPLILEMEKMCGKGDCKGCLIVQAKYKCSLDMKKCTARLINDGKIKKDPCGSTASLNCKSNLVTNHFQS